MRVHWVTTYKGQYLTPLVHNWVLGPHQLIQHDMVATPLTGWSLLAHCPPSRQHIRNNHQVRDLSEIINLGLIQYVFRLFGLIKIKLVVVWRELELLVHVTRLERHQAVNINIKVANIAGVGRLLSLASKFTMILSILTICSNIWPFTNWNRKFSFGGQFIKVRICRVYLVANPFSPFRIAWVRFSVSTIFIDRSPIRFHVNFQLCQKQEPFLCNW